MPLSQAEHEHEKHIGLLKSCVGVVADSGLPIPSWDSAELVERLRKILGQRDAALDALEHATHKCDDCPKPADFADWLAEWSDRSMCVCEKHTVNVQKYYDNDHKSDQTGLCWAKLPGGAKAREVLRAAGRLK